MVELFETKVVYDKMMENGTQKRVTEKFLVYSASVSDSENMAIEELKSYIHGEFMVTTSKLVKYADVVMDNSDDVDNFYKVAYDFITLDEKSGAAKRNRMNTLVKAGDLHDAVERFGMFMRGIMMDFEIVSVSKTNIVALFK